jgi:hypothetical protein
MAPPAGDFLSRLGQRPEPLLVEAFVAEFAVEALDISVLRRAARFIQQVLDAMVRRPRHKGPAGEFRPLIRADRFRVALMQRRSIQQARHVFTAHAVIDGKLHAFAAEIVDYRQTFDAPPVRESVHHKVGAPDFVRPMTARQGLPLYRHPFRFTTFAYRQARLFV